MFDGSRRFARGKLALLRQITLFIRTVKLPKAKSGGEEAKHNKKAHR
jgi:hypothetical protein